jgi:hypothetical protein
LFIAQGIQRFLRNQSIQNEGFVLLFYLDGPPRKPEHRQLCNGTVPRVCPREWVVPCENAAENTQCGSIQDDPSDVYTECPSIIQRQQRVLGTRSSSFRKGKGSLASLVFFLKLFVCVQLESNVKTFLYC